MDRGLDLIEALNQISKERGIDKDVIFETIETSLVTACKKNFGSSQNVKIIIDRETGDVKVFAQKEVCENPTDPNNFISLEDAKAIKPFYELGDTVDILLKPRNFGRIAAQTAKQVVVQKFREAERERLYNEYITKEHQVITGIVQRKEHKNIYVALGKLDGVLAPNEQLFSDKYNFGDRIKVYVTEVRQTTKGPSVNVSRTHPELVKKLFAQEVPEVYEGIIEIKSVAREAGNRSKIAVYSNNPNIDPVGSCVGQNGSRVNVIVSELNGEKIDILNYSDNIVKYIAEALNPAKVKYVHVDLKAQSAKVVVDENQLSLAIGKDGQNARLAAKLCSWKIDIKSVSQIEDLSIFTPVNDSVAPIVMEEEDLYESEEFI